jgi:transcription antitermination factor NusG
MINNFFIGNRVHVIREAFAGFQGNVVELNKINDVVVELFLCVEKQISALNNIK